MEFAPVAVGVLMIVLGFLVKRFHRLVAIQHDVENG